MSITIYWSCIEKEWMRSKPPQPVKSVMHNNQLFKDSKDGNVNFFRCPSFNQITKNTFSIQSIYDYSFSIQDKNVFSKDYDQEFFNNHLTIRDIKSKMFSFRQSYYFFCKEDIEMEILPPFFSNNDISNKTIVIPGIFNISKWFRPTDFAFYFKEKENFLNINNEDDLYYIRFLTDKKIKFLQFRNNRYIDELASDCTNARNFLSLSKYYEMMKIKKNVLSEIKKNVI